MADGVMNPSTYRQVRENMKRLNEFFGDGGSGSGGLTEIMQTIQELKDDIEKLEESLGGGTGGGTAGGDLVQDENGNIMVYGVRIVTQFADEDLTPAAYTRDVTFELKKTDVVGLNAMPGFAAGAYVLVITYKHNLPTGESVDPFAYLPQQIAYGTNMKAYTRTSVDTAGSAWSSPWTEVNPASEFTFNHPIFVQSETEPSDLKESDYWFEPLGEVPGVPDETT